MLGKRHSKEYFSDVLDDLKRLFSVQQQRRFDFVSKKCFVNSHSEIRKVYPGLPQLSKMESFAVKIKFLIVPVKN